MFYTTSRLRLFIYLICHLTIVKNSKGIMKKAILTFLAGRSMHRLLPPWHPDSKHGFHSQKNVLIISRLDASLANHIKMSVGGQGQLYVHGLVPPEAIVRHIRRANYVDNDRQRQPRYLFGMQWVHYDAFCLSGIPVGGAWYDSTGHRSSDDELELTMSGDRVRGNIIIRTKDGVVARSLDDLLPLDFTEEDKLGNGTKYTCTFCNAPVRRGEYFCDGCNELVVIQLMSGYFHPGFAEEPPY